MVKPKAADNDEKSSGPKGWPGLADCFVGRLGRMRRATTRAALRAFVAQNCFHFIRNCSKLARSDSFQKLFRLAGIVLTSGFVQ
jgi:hypothetical protein